MKCAGTWRRGLSPGGNALHRAEENGQKKNGRAAVQPNDQKLKSSGLHCAYWGRGKHREKAKPGEGWDLLDGR